MFMSKDMFLDESGGAQANLNNNNNNIANGAVQNGGGGNNSAKDDAANRNSISTNAERQADMQQKLMQQRAAAINKQRMGGAVGPTVGGSVVQTGLSGNQAGFGAPSRPSMPQNPNFGSNNFINNQNLNNDPNLNSQQQTNNTSSVYGGVQTDYNTQQQPSSTVFQGSQLPSGGSHGNFTAPPFGSSTSIFGNNNNSASVSPGLAIDFGNSAVSPPPRPQGFGGNSNNSPIKSQQFSGPLQYGTQQNQNGNLGNSMQDGNSSDDAQPPTSVASINGANQNFSIGSNNNNGGGHNSNLNVQLNLYEGGPGSGNSSNGSVGPGYGSAGGPRDSSTVNNTMFDISNPNLADGAQIGIAPDNDDSDMVLPVVQEGSMLSQQQENMNNSDGTNVQGQGQGSGAGQPSGTLSTLESDLQRRGLMTVFDPQRGLGGTQQYMQNGTSNVRRFDPSLIGNNMHAFLTTRIPKGVFMECHVQRTGSYIGSFYSKYIMRTDVDGISLLSAQKKVKNKTSNYLISMNENDMNKGNNYLGKVRSNFMGSEYITYNAGLNPEKAGSVVQTEMLREELCAVTYCSTIWGKKPRGPRRMTAVIPKLIDGTNRLVCRPLKNGGEGGLLQAAKFVNENVVSVEESPVEVLVNKPPKWNEQLGAFVLNFNKRVTQASVKNFQLISKNDPDTVVLQFGRVGKDLFNMDFRYPLSPLQAFSIVLSSFDYKLCCE